MATYSFGHGTPPADPYVYGVNLDGETVIARHGEREFKTERQLRDEHAALQAENDQILAEWQAAVDADSD